MTYSITVCKYGYELTVINMPDEFELTEELDISDVEEEGDCVETYVCVDEARVVVTDMESGEEVFDDFITEDTVSDTHDATVDYTPKTVLHEVGWRTQTYESETLPTYRKVNFGEFTAVCLNTDNMEFCESWDGRWQELLPV